MEPLRADQSTTWRNRLHYGLLTHHCISISFKEQDQVGADIKVRAAADKFSVSADSDIDVVTRRVISMKKLVELTSHTVGLRTSGKSRSQGGKLNLPPQNGKILWNHGWQFHEKLTSLISPLAHPMAISIVYRTNLYSGAVHLLRVSESTC